MTSTNLCLVLKEKHSFHFEEREIPKITDSHDVLLKILNVGICGSDVHFYEDGRLGDYVVRAPHILGHETSAVVVKCGDKVTKLKEGDRVAVEPGVTCRRCNYCITGRYNLCDKMAFHSLAPVEGTLRQFITHPEDLCFKLPSSVSNEEGALVEPSSVGVHACRRAKITLGSKVLITGAGPIGLVTMMVARAYGAETIVIVDFNEQRLELAKSLGADFTIHINKDLSTKDIVEKIREHFNCLVDKSIECSGAADAFSLCIEATSPGGCIVVVGIGAPTITIPFLSALVKEVEIHGVFIYTNCYPTALSLISQKRVNVLPLITHRFQFSNAQEAFETAKSGKGIKVMIEVSKV